MTQQRQDSRTAAIFIRQSSFWETKDTRYRSVSEKECPHSMKIKAILISATSTRSQLLSGDFQTYTNLHIFA